MWQWRLGRRVAVDGRRTDDNARCTLVAIREYGGTLALYPHGVGTFGVRLSRADAAVVLGLFADTE
ncbi:MAG TPA: hypothetical protein VGJ13_09955 [Pseudonocardiaceae bacterium]